MDPGIKTWLVIDKYSSQQQHTRRVLSENRFSGAFSVALSADMDTRVVIVATPCEEGDVTVSSIRV